MRKDKDFGKLKKFSKTMDKGGRGINDSKLKENVFSDSKQLFIEDKELLLMGRDMDISLILSMTIG